jgi:dienelactone hydrolase
VARTNEVEHVLCVPAGGVWLDACISLPSAARTLVLFAQGSGNGRFSARDRTVSDGLRAAGIGTLAFDLLTRDEDASPEQQAHVRFDTVCLGERFADVTRWACRHELARGLHICYFGSCTGAAAALRAAGDCPDVVRAVVCRAGRFDLVPDALARVRAPTLLLAGETDSALLQLSQQALQGITAPKQLQILPGGSLLPPEPSALEPVTRLTVAWFQRHARAG